MKRFDGNTPLHVACGRENVGMVALLMAGKYLPLLWLNLLGVLVFFLQLVVKHPTFWDMKIHFFSF